MAKAYNDNGIKECPFRYKTCVGIKCPDNVWCNKTSCASIRTNRETK